MRNYSDIKADIQRTEADMQRLASELADLGRELKDARKQEHAGAVKEVRKLCREYNITTGMLKGYLAKGKKRRTKSEMQQDGISAQPEIPAQSDFSAQSDTSASAQSDFSAQSDASGDNA